MICPVTQWNLQLNQTTRWGQLGSDFLFLVYLTFYLPQITWNVIREALSQIMYQLASMKFKVSLATLVSTYYIIT